MRQRLVNLEALQTTLVVVLDNKIVSFKNQTLFKSQTQQSAHKFSAGGSFFFIFCPTVTFMLQKYHFLQQILRFCRSVCLIACLPNQANLYYCFPLSSFNIILDINGQSKYLTLMAGRCAHAFLFCHQLFPTVYVQLDKKKPIVSSVVGVEQLLMEFGFLARCMRNVHFQQRQLNDVVTLFLVC